LPQAQPGDGVLIYLGQMVSVVEAEEALAVCELLQELRTPVGWPPEEPAAATYLSG
jgi:hydrogenase maturation factor